MGLGNGNPKYGDKGSNFNYELKVLQLLDGIANGVQNVGSQDFIYTEGIIEPAAQAALVKMNQTITDKDDIEYEVYKLKGIINLKGTTVYTNLVGVLVASNKLLPLTTQNQVVAREVNVFNVITTPYGTSSLAVNDLSGNPLAVNGFVILDNSIALPNEWFITFLTTGSANFSCDIYIDMDFGVPVGTTVTFVN
jgi:hypothetical protein